MSIAWSGVWRSGSDGHYLWVNASLDNFIAKWQELSAQNLRLVDLENITVGGQQRWSGVWRSGTGGHFLWVNADWNNFVAKWQELSAQNLRLSVIKVHDAGGGQRYSGVWRPGSDGHFLWNSDWASFNSKWAELSAQNMRLVDLDTYISGGVRRWIGAWRPGTGGHFLWVNADWNNFVAKWNELATQNLRLTIFKSYLIGGQRRFAGVWAPGSDGYYLWSGASFENFIAKWQELSAQNLRLIKLETWDAGLTPTVRVHAKVLSTPTIPIETMVTRMREVYESVGIQVQLASTENLNLPDLNDCDVGSCVLGSTTAEQDTLFGNRNNVGANEVVVYFVRSTVPPFNGCASHPTNRPGAVVVQGATQWTLAHELGHVLGLRHVNNNDQLMTGNGTGNITNPPPDLAASEVTTMRDSPLTINL
jgi:hypothetical protein